MSDRTVPASPAAPSAPAPPFTGQHPFEVLVVCTGNICRSPMAEHVLRRAFRDAGLDERVTVSSAGTGDWHVGQAAHAPARRTLDAAGYSSDHSARQVTKAMVDAADLVLAADRGHLDVLRTMASDPTTVRLLRQFDATADHDEVPDPYGHPDEEYRLVLTMLQAATPGLVNEVRRRLA